MARKPDPPEKPKRVRKKQVAKPAPVYVCVPCKLAQHRLCMQGGCNCGRRSGHPQ